jgi:hypothetical protein
MAEILFYHLYRLSQCFYSLLCIPNFIMKKTIISVDLIIKQKGRNQAFLESTKPLLQIRNAIIILFILFMKFSNPSLYLCHKHSYIIWFFSDYSIKLIIEILIIFNPSLIFLQYLEYFEEIYVVDDVVWFEDKIIENDHISVL